MQRLALIPNQTGLSKRSLAHAYTSRRIQFPHQGSTQKLKAGSRKRLLRLPGSKVQLE